MGKQLKAEEIIRKNKRYFNIAKKEGFFKDHPDHISMSEEWPIGIWIDELVDKDDEEVFIKEQLPSFRRWFKAGIRTNLIGKSYNLLRLGESRGLKIDTDVAECLMHLELPIGMHDSIEYRLNPAVVDYIKKCIDNLVELNKNGIPLRHETGGCYNALMDIKEKGKKVDFDTFVFFASGAFQKDEYKMSLYKAREMIGKKYDYYPSTMDEVELLTPYFIDGKGYNTKYVEKLEKKLKEYENDVNLALEGKKNMSKIKMDQAKQTIDLLSWNINRHKNTNILKKYYEKFGTLAGLAYLEKRPFEFIELVDPAKYPIDNLFAICFEDTSFIPKDNTEEFLDCLKILHDGFVVDKIEIDSFNDGLPIDRYINQSERKRIDNVVVGAPTLTPKEALDVSYMNRQHHR